MKDSVRSKLLAVPTLFLAGIYFVRCESGTGISDEFVSQPFNEVDVTTLSVAGADGIIVEPEGFRSPPEPECFEVTCAGCPGAIEGCPAYVPPIGGGFFPKEN